MKDTFVISCPIDTYSGYGSRSRDLVKALIELDKYEVKIMPQRWGNTPWDFIENNPEWHFLKPHLLPVGQPLTEKPNVWAQVTVPNEFQPIGDYNIGFTAGIETTICAPQWIEGLNRMDLNIVSSQHSKQVFENATFQVKDKNTNQVTGEIKLTKPVEVLFEGADLDLYKPTKSSFPLEIKESFAYLFVGHWMQGDLGEDRKNVGLLVKAFFETFKNKKTKPALILKTSGSGTSYMDRESILKKINAIRASVNSNNLPNIYLLHGEFTDEEMNSIYNHPKIKSMISLTKGEGFGRPLLEFSLSQKPIITTNWSGHIDFLKPEFTSLIGGELKNVHPSAAVKDMILQESKWFAPNHGEIGHYLKDVFENYKNYVGKGKRQAYYSKTNFSWEGMKQLLGDILENNVTTQVELKIPTLTKIDLSKL